MLGSRVRSAKDVLKELSRHGAELREKDAISLKRLRGAFAEGTSHEKNLFVSDLRHLKVLGASEVRASEHAVAFGERQSALCSLNAVQTYKYWPTDYIAPDDLAGFLCALYPEDAPHEVGEKGSFEAPDHCDSMAAVIESSKLFVQERVACGCVSRPSHIFALHLFTLRTSIGREVAKCMNGAADSSPAAMWEGVRKWRPFLYHMHDALLALNATSAIAFRGCKLSGETSGTVASLLDGKYPNGVRQSREGARPPTRPHLWACAHLVRKLEFARSGAWLLPKLHPNSIILWPAFSSLTTDHGLAMREATHGLKAHEAAVVFKVFTQRARPLSSCSLFPTEAELLCPPNTAFRVTQLSEPTAFNLRKGTREHEARREFHVSADYLLHSGLDLDDARRRQVLLISLVEEPLPEGSAFVVDESSAEAESVACTQAGAYAEEALASEYGGDSEMPVMVNISTQVSRGFLGTDGGGSSDAMAMAGAGSEGIGQAAPLQDAGRAFQRFVTSISSWLSAALPR